MTLHQNITKTLFGFLLLKVGFKSKFEVKKFFSIAITKFFTVYIFSILRGLNYSILVPKLGAEVISAIELYCLLPVSSLFVVLYFKMGKHFSRITIASIMLVFFMTFFLIFNFYLFPHHDEICINLTNIKLQFPRLKYIILLIENWDISLFYLFAELWGIMMLSLSFWQLANEVSTVVEAKKYYGFYGAIGQSGMIVAGWSALMVSDFFTGNTQEEWSVKFNILMLSVFATSILLLYSYWWISVHIWNFVRIEEKKYEKVKLSLKESFKYVISSKYLRMIATLIICYGVLMFISETLWKAQVGSLHKTPSDYSRFMGSFQVYMGYGTVAGMLFAVLSLRYLSWLFNALTTPISFVFTGVIFLSLVIFREYIANFLSYTEVQLLSTTIFVGMMQILFAKSFKYSLFDLSKEMLYIPLDKELRTNGKAAVDIISQRVGRSGGSIITLVLLFIFPSATIISLTPFFFIIFLLMGILWIHATIALNKEFLKISS